MPELRRRHQADCVHHPAGPDPKDPDTSRRTARATTGVAGPGPTHRLGRARADARRPRSGSGVARRAAGDRHPQPLSGGGRDVTTKSPGGRTRRDSAPTAEKCHSRGRAAVPGTADLPLIWRRKTRHQPHQPSIGSEMPIDMVAEVPLAGLSFDAGGKWTKKQQSPSRHSQIHKSTLKSRPPFSLLHDAFDHLTPKANSYQSTPRQNIY